jgi:hypothetical protein
VNIGACEHGLWANMPGAMSANVELAAAATTPECAAVALGATRQALTASSVLSAAAQSASFTVDLLSKLNPWGLPGDVAAKVVQAALQSGGTLDGFKDQLGEGAMEQLANMIGGKAGDHGPSGTELREKAYGEIAEQVFKYYRGTDFSETHSDTFHGMACDGEFTVTVTANFLEARGEVRIAASGDCHCTEFRGGVRVGPFSVVGVAPLTFGNLTKQGGEWVLTCTMGGPHYDVWAPCCQVRDGHWVSARETPVPQVAVFTPTPTAAERKRDADRTNVLRRCDPDGTRLSDLFRAQMRFDWKRADGSPENVLRAARAEVVRLQKPFCDCLNAMRADPAFRGDVGLQDVIADLLRNYCEPPVEVTPRPTPVPRAALPPCSADRDGYEAARVRWSENPNSAEATLSMVRMREGLCACLRQQHGGKLPPDLEAFCNPKVYRNGASAPQIAMGTTSVAPAGTETVLVGVIFSTDTARGERTTGTVVTDPQRYENRPDVVVLKTTVRLPKGPDGKPTLTGTTVTVGGGPAQPADGPIRCDVPKTGTVPVTVNPPGSPAVPAGEVPAHDAPGATPTGTHVPPTCAPGEPIRVTGPFDGDASNTTVRAGDKPVRVVAESPRGCVVQLPPDLPPGPVDVTVTEGGRTTRHRTASVRLKMSADQLDLLRGQSTKFHVVVEGLNGLPESAWTGGPDPAFLNRAALDRAAPGARIPGRTEPGYLLLTIENGSRDTITLAKSTGEVIRLEIRRGDVSAKGTYEYHGVINSLKDGRFNVKGTLFALVAPSEARP